MRPNEIIPISRKNPTAEGIKIAYDIPPATHCSFPTNLVIHRKIKNLACGVCEAFRLAFSKENYLRKTFTELDIVFKVHFA